MTRAQRIFYRRRYTLWIVAALLFLGGGLALAFLQIDKAEHRADQIAAEADLRGSAVSTLATDVRQLRSQLQADGKTPVAPDPSSAVEDLPDRAEVPVPIPGPPGPPGANGADGQDGRPAPTVTPAPGRAGAQGVPGADSTAPGPAGPVGPAGPAGSDGADSSVPGPQGERGDRGEAGPPPAGWSFSYGGADYDCTPDSAGGSHFTCRTSSPEPAPDSPGGSGTTALGLDPSRRQYP